MRKTLLFALCYTFVAGILLSPSQGVAKTYKWVDDNGVTQYTATPPPAGDYKTIKDPAKPAVDPVKAQGELEERLKAFNKRQDEQSKEKAEATKKAEETATAKKNCEQAKKNLDVLQNRVRIRYTEKDGSLRFLGKEERKANIKRANEAIKSYCKEK